MLPGLLVYSPVPQGVQFCDPVAAAKLCSGQSTHVSAPAADVVERRKRLLDAAASLGAEHDSLVQEARGRLRRQLARELQSLAPFRFNRRKLQAHLRDEPMRAYVHYSQPVA